MLTGGCFCGQTRYQAAGTPFHSTICHCADCRRIAGAPLVAWFSVKSSDFTITRGTPQRFASSPAVTRRFCPNCGTPLTYQNAHHAEEIDILTATLDNPNAVPPQDHVYAAHRLAWLHIDDGLPHHPGPRPA